MLDFGESQLEAQPTISGSFRRKTPQTKPKSNIAQHKTSNNSKFSPAKRVLKTLYSVGHSPEGHDVNALFH
ncbi:MAG: hypothetical protein ACLUW6_08420, partial [Coriobacteriaceae bacterium]